MWHHFLLSHTVWQLLPSKSHSVAHWYLSTAVLTMGGEESLWHQTLSHLQLGRLWACPGGGTAWLFCYPVKWSLSHPLARGLNCSRLCYAWFLSGTVGLFSLMFSLPGSFHFCGFPCSSISLLGQSLLFLILTLSHRCSELCRSVKERETLQNEFRLSQSSRQNQSQGPTDQSSAEALFIDTQESI